MSTIKELVVSHITDNIYVGIPEEVVSTINVIMRDTSNKFENIETILLDIIDDNKIDFNDVPHFIKIIEEIYYLLIQNKKYLKSFTSKSFAIVSGELLKIMVRVLVERENKSPKKLTIIVNDVSDSDNDSDISQVQLNEVGNLKNKEKFFENADNVIDISVKLLLIPISSGCTSTFKKIFKCC